MFGTHCGVWNSLQNYTFQIEANKMFISNQIYRYSTRIWVLITDSTDSFFFPPYWPSNELNKSGVPAEYLLFVLIYWHLMACSSDIAFPRSIKWVFTFLFSFLLSTKVYRVLHAMCLPVLKFCGSPHIKPENVFLKWSSHYSGWFRNKPQAQKIKTSAHFMFQYSCGIL